MAILPELALFKRGFSPKLRILVISGKTHVLTFETADRKRKINVNMTLKKPK